MYTPHAHTDQPIGTQQFMLRTFRTTAQVRMISLEQGQSHISVLNPSTPACSTSRAREAIPFNNIFISKHTIIQRSKMVIKPQ